MINLLTIFSSSHHCKLFFRLQFVDLELELIDDFRVSLLQILHSEHSDPINSKIPAISNTILHLKTALGQYDASPVRQFYLVINTICNGVLIIINTSKLHFL